MPVGLPENLARALVDSGRSSLELRVRLGDAAATSEAIALLKKGEAAAKKRIAIARMLGEVKADESLQPLLDVSVAAANAELQRAALTAVSWSFAAIAPDFTAVGSSNAVPTASASEAPRRFEAAYWFITAVTLP